MVGGSVAQKPYINTVPSNTSETSTDAPILGLLCDVQYSLQEIRPISTSRLNALLHVHLRPINLIIS